MKPSDFIAKIAPAAQESMRKTGIPASLVIAQAALESAWGESGLAKNSNNLFGIKGKGKDYQTKEQLADGTWVTIVAGFRVYDSWYDSIKDHSYVLLNAKFPNGKYRYRAVVGEKDYRKACYIVQEGGYATDQQYGKKLISIIETYELYKYDTLPAKPVAPTKPKEESEDDAPMKLEQWQKELIVSEVQKWSKVIVGGEPVINSPDYWIKKVNDGTLTAGDLATLSFAIVSRAVKK